MQHIFALSSLPVWVSSKEKNMCVHGSGACWHACPTCQSIVPKFHPITEGRFHHSKTPEHSPERPFPAPRLRTRHTLEVTRLRKSVTMGTRRTSCDDEPTCAARTACISVEDESGTNRCSSKDVWCFSINCNLRCCQRLPKPDVAVSDPRAEARKDMSR